ncbi:hypothetical protein WMY93_007816 [Mugilogobius chulae]|uniref:Uncharacterized protein n=1 Tax=Mugilogobius chulae TaxID=88201 RepID=A0AAW0PFE8_9GOBI
MLLFQEKSRGSQQGSSLSIEGCTATGKAQHSTTTVPPLVHCRAPPPPHPPHYPPRTHGADTTGHRAPCPGAWSEKYTRTASPKTTRNQPTPNRHNHLTVLEASRQLDGEATRYSITASAEIAAEAVDAPVPPRLRPYTHLSKNVAARLHKNTDKTKDDPKKPHTVESSHNLLLFLSGYDPIMSTHPSQPLWERSAPTSERLGGHTTSGRTVELSFSHPHVSDWQIANWCCSWLGAATLVAFLVHSSRFARDAQTILSDRSCVPLHFSGAAGLCAGVVPNKIHRWHSSSDVPRVQLGLRSGLGSHHLHAGRGILFCLRTDIYEDAMY